MPTKKETGIKWAWEKHSKLIAEMKYLDDGDEPMNANQEKRWNELLAESQKTMAWIRTETGGGPSDVIAGFADDTEQYNKDIAEMASNDDALNHRSGSGSGGPSPVGGWTNKHTGEPVTVLAPRERLTALHPGSENLCVGRLLRAMALGKPDLAEAEIEAASSTTTNWAAGYLVNESLSANIIDLARDKSVLLAAGAITIAMDSSTLSIARVASDVTFAVHAENATITASDFGFDRVNLTAYTIAALVKVSRELMSDAANFDELITDQLAKSIAVQLDTFGLVGTGSAQPLGITNSAEVKEIAVGGALDYDTLLDAVEDVWDSNGRPDAYILRPAQAIALAKLKKASEANNYASGDLPDEITRLQRLVSNSVISGEAYLGQFTNNVLLGIREEILIEATTQGGNSFEENAIYFRITFRGDWAIEHGNMLVKMTGIS